MTLDTCSLYKFEQLNASLQLDRFLWFSLHGCLLLCSFRSLKQQNFISFDNEKNHATACTAEVRHGGRHEFLSLHEMWRRRSGCGGDWVTIHWSVTLQESSNWKWNGPYFGDQSFVEPLYSSKMYRPCTAQSSRKKHWTDAYHLSPFLFVYMFNAIRRYSHHCGKNLWHVLPSQS